MPPLFFAVATIVSLLMVVLYIRTALEEGLSFWVVFRTAFWMGLAGFLIWMFVRARKARSDDTQSVA
jgi:hypothetical protein